MDSSAAGTARIPPGSPRRIGAVNYLIVRAIGWKTGTGPLNVFTTLARHRRLFRNWIRFAVALMPYGSLPRADTELVILRVARNCACEYELRHHATIAAAAGLTPDQLAAIPDGAAAPVWGPRQVLLLRAADELHASRTITEPLWRELAGTLTEEELIELCMLVGHYEMLAMTLNSLGVQPDSAVVTMGRRSRS